MVLVNVAAVELMMQDGENAVQIFYLENGNPLLVPLRYVAPVALMSKEYISGGQPRFGNAELNKKLAGKGRIKSRWNGEKEGLEILLNEI